MSRLEDLPADRKAVLQLLLKQGKSYEDLSSLLRIEPDAVAERARDALDQMGPEDSAGLSMERQDEIADYLLGQQSASERAATRSFLEGSAAGRAWARVVAGELRPLAGDALPEIPSERAEVDEAFDALEARKVARVEREKSSRVGGMLILAGLGVAVAVALILALRGGDDDKGSPAATNTATQTTATDGLSNLPEGFESQINLTGRGGNTLAVVYVLKTGNKRTLAIAGQGFPRTTQTRNYAVWLYNSANDAQRLGFAPPIAADGRLAAGVDATRIEQKAERDRVTRLMNNFYSYKELIVTSESSPRPTRPGTIVVQGAIKRPAA
jgi:hypothetical protein